MASARAWREYRERVLYPLLRAGEITRGDRDGWRGVYVTESGPLRPGLRRLFVALEARGGGDAGALVEEVYGWLPADGWGHQRYFDLGRHQAACDILARRGVTVPVQDIGDLIAAGR